jgi:serine acetyltransferase
MKLGPALTFGVDIIEDARLGSQLHLPHQSGTVICRSLVHTLCMRHQVTWCASRATIDNASLEGSS